MSRGISINICFVVVVACSCSPVGVEPGPIYLEAPPAPVASPAPVRRTAERSPVLSSAAVAGSAGAGATSEAAPGQGSVLPFGGGGSAGSGDGVGVPTLSPDGGAREEDGAEASRDDVEAAAPDGRSQGCGLPAPALTSGTHTISVGGELRSYDVVMPGAAAGPAPVLVALHGYTMRSADMAAMTGWSELAALEGAVVVYPQGDGALPGWNAGGCCTLDPQQRDVELIDALLDTLEAGACIDRQRVYVAGFSNGGMLAYRLACERAERLAAVASVAGSIALPLAECRPARAVPLLHVHGTADTIVPYLGGRAGDLLQGPLGGPAPTFPSVEVLVEHVATLNGCAPDTATALESGAALCTEWSRCSSGAPVELCTLLGGAHIWPGDARLPALVRGFAASDVVWSFLSSQRAPLP